jgi:hypothetical protein
VTTGEAADFYADDKSPPDLKKGQIMSDHAPILIETTGSLPATLRTYQ